MAITAPRHQYGPAEERFAYGRSRKSERPRWEVWPGHSPLRVAKSLEACERPRAWEGERPRAWEGERPREPQTSLIMPLQITDYTLIQPIVRTFRQPFSYWIISHIQPFILVLIPHTHLGIPTTALPQSGRVIFGRTLALPYFLRNQSFPISHPQMKIMRRICRWRTKEMHMIRHYHISTNHPFIGTMPCRQNFVNHIWTSE